MTQFTDRPMYAGAVKNKRKKPGDSNKHYSDEQKIELVKMYMVTGVLSLAAASLKIPEVTARNWKTKDWWKQLENELRFEKNIKLSSRLQRIVERCLDAVEDRLENGDWIYDQKIGELRRKPVGLKDVHKVAMDMVDRVDVIEKAHVAAPELQDSMADRFAKLAEQFATLATKQQEKPPVEVTDVIYVEEKKNSTNSAIGGEDDRALHEERKEGL